MRTKSQNKKTPSQAKRNKPKSQNFFFTRTKNPNQQSTLVKLPMDGERESSDQSPVVPNLHHDVVFDIFSRLPVKPLVQFRSVSKPFLSLIHDPLFLKLHVNKTLRSPKKGQVFLYYESLDCTQQKFSIFNHDLVSKTLIEDTKIGFPFKSKYGYLRIAGSSNGLICFVDTNYFSYYGMLFLWNPVLGKFKVLPGAHLTHRINDAFSHMVVGFAFVSEISDFKTVQILYDLDKGSETNASVLVYTLGENCWRKIDALVPCYMPKSWSENVFVNGSIHWMACKGPNSGSVVDRIMLFDMSNEVFGEFGLPKNVDPNYKRPKLSASCRGDTLSLFSLCRENLWEVWLMREYGVVESWVKQYNLEEMFITFPLRFMDNGDILAVLENGNLVLFDTEKHSYEETAVYGLTSSFCAVAYTESLGLLEKGDQVFRV